ncbi:MAG: UMP kinase [Verrucomicrobia bacterium]|nr:UMP kinase [Verrucomicrobiota bacterium]MCH8527069.1 UMP kinase [Kiritimatiellia bacterium]
MTEPFKPKYKRILLKLSGETLHNKTTGHNLDADVILSVARQIKTVHAAGVQVALVVGGGNIFRGLAGEKHGISRSQGDYMGMLATVINSLALQSTLEQIGVETRVLSAITMPRIAEPFILRRGTRHLQKGRVVIFAAGTGNPFFTTDSAAALRASEIQADCLLKGTKVDGIYDKDPKVHTDAVRYESITYQEAISRRLKVMDTAAFSLCHENHIPIVVFDFFKTDELLRVVAGEPVGTSIHE